MKFNIVTFYKKNLEKLRELAKDCPDCLRDSVECHHLDYLRDYIKELEALPPFDSEKFDLFWKEYPRKDGKKYALKIFQKIGVDDALFAKIMATLEKYKQSRQWTKDKGEFIPHASTWLNQERWEDEVELPGNKGASEYSEIKTTKI